MTALSKAVTPTWCIAVLLFAGAFIGTGSTLDGQDDERCKLRENNTVNRCEVFDTGDPLTYFKGTDEPLEDWNSPDFVEGIGWLEGANPIGYGEQNFLFETELIDMPSGYLSVFTRSWFTVEM